MVWEGGFAEAAQVHVTTCVHACEHLIVHRYTCMNEYVILTLEDSAHAI